MDLDNTFWCSRCARREPAQRDPSATLVGISRYGRCQDDAEPLETPDEPGTTTAWREGAADLLDAPGDTSSRTSGHRDEQLEPIYSALRRMGKEIAELKKELRNNASQAQERRRDIRVDLGDGENSNAGRPAQ